MIITKIKKSIPYFDVFTLKTVNGLYIETKFDLEQKVFDSFIRELTVVTEVINNETITREVIGTDDIAFFKPATRIIVDTDTDLQFVSVNNNMLDTFNNWIKDRIKAYILKQTNPINPSEFLFTQNDLEQIIC